MMRENNKTPIKNTTFVQMLATILEPVAWLFRPVAFLFATSFSEPLAPGPILASPGTCLVQFSSLVG